MKKIYLFEFYIYDRKEKAYILKSDPIVSCYDYAVVVKSYEA